MVLLLCPKYHPYKGVAGSCSSREPLYHLSSALLFVTRSHSELETLQSDDEAPLIPGGPQGKVDPDPHASQNREAGCFISQLALVMCCQVCYQETTFFGYPKSVLAR
jgi:hypothetical protein